MSKRLYGGLLYPSILAKAWDAENSRTQSPFVKSMLNQTLDLVTSDATDVSQLQGVRLRMRAEAAVNSHAQIGSFKRKIKPELAKAVRNPNFVSYPRQSSRAGIIRYLQLVEIGEKMALTPMDVTSNEIIVASDFNLDDVPTTEEVVRELAFQNVREAAKQLEREKIDLRKKFKLAGIKGLPTIVKQKSRIFLKIDLSIYETPVPRRFVPMDAKYHLLAEEFMKEYSSIGGGSNSKWDEKGLGSFEDYSNMVANSLFSDKLKRGGVSGEAYFVVGQSFVPIGKMTARNYQKLNL